ncbi:MAG: hypothetical protein M1160_03430 [Candidatus Marsarchaeota archaeon]|jgi:hypothetical protein|nr:hypothetical protein [Candidatus Marsarchaeota archaeon]MCL5111897.1 hypothetical protein [Candidatus Marsarchaeota archaeon]
MTEATCDLPPELVTRHKETEDYVLSNPKAIEILKVVGKNPDIPYAELRERVAMEPRELEGLVDGFARRAIIGRSVVVVGGLITNSNFKLTHIGEHILNIVESGRR